EAHPDLEWRRVGEVMLAALVLAHLRLAEGVAGLARIRAGHGQLQVHVATGEVLNGRNLREQLFQAFPEEPLERVTLDFDQIGDGRDLSDAGERVPGSTVR